MRFKVNYPSGHWFTFELPLTTELRSVTGLVEALADHRGRPSIEIEEVFR